MHTKVLIIIPAFNEEENLKTLLDEVKLQKELADYVIINDCSEDHTAELLQKIGAHYVNLPVNLGIGGAVQTGFQYALENGYDVAVQVDGDGQHDVSYLKDLLELIRLDKADICIGSRFLEGKGFQSSVMRRAGIKFLSTLIYICTKKKIYDVTSGFRAVSGDFLRLFAKNYPVDYPEPESLVAAALSGARIGEIPVVMRERKKGVSSISPVKSVYYMLKVSIAILLQKLLGGNYRRCQTR